MQINVKAGKRTFKLTQTEVKKLRDAVDIIAAIGMVIDTTACQAEMSKVIGAAVPVLAAHARVDVE